MTHAVGEARDAVDRLLGHRILRRRSAEVSAESALRGARAAAALEGVSVPLDELRGGAVDDPVVQGALRVFAELGALSGTWRAAPRQALAKLHVLAAADGVPAGELGRPRTSDDGRLNDAAALRSGCVFVAGPAKRGPTPTRSLGLLEVSARLGALSELLISKTKASALVVAAIVHGELLALRPFGWGDGLVARAASRLTLIDRGLDPKSLVAPEVGHVELGAAYKDSLNGYITGTPDGVADWVRHCASAVALGARDSLAVCEALLRG